MSPGTSTRNETIYARRLGCESMEELAEATRGWEFGWRQLDRGPLSADLLQIELPSTLVSRFQVDRQFHQRGRSPAGMRTFGIVGRRSSPVEWKGREWSKNQIEVFPAHDFYESVSHPGFLGNGISVPEDRIRSTAETLGVPDPLDWMSEGSCFIVPDPHRLNTLRRTLQRLYDEVSASGPISLGSTASSDLDFDILTALVNALASTLDTGFRRPSPTVRSRALRSALDYIEAHADTAPTVSDICRASGASYRTLNYAFLDRFGVAPKQYLQAVRLEGARKDLQDLEPHEAISDAANRWGFWHMGQFARDYRRQFGELPSETLRRGHLSLQ